MCQNGAVVLCGPSRWGLRWSSLWGHEPRQGCAKMGRRCHADPLAGAFGGAPYWATNRVSGVPKWGGGAMRTFPPGPSVELLMGPRSAVLGGVDACGRCHWSLRWSSLWGHETLSWVALTHATAATGAFGGTPYGATNRLRGVPKWGSMSGADACEHPHWGLRWSSLWGHETLSWVGGRMRTPPRGPSVELPMGPRSWLRSDYSAPPKQFFELKVVAPETARKHCFRIPRPAARRLLDLRRLWPRGPLLAAVIVGDERGRARSARQCAAIRRRPRARTTDGPRARTL